MFAPPTGDPRHAQVGAGLILPPEIATPGLCARLLEAAVREAIVPYLDSDVGSWDVYVGRRFGPRGSASYTTHTPKGLDLDTAMALLRETVAGAPSTAGLEEQLRLMEDVVESFVCHGRRGGVEPPPMAHWCDRVFLNPDLRSGTIQVSVPQDLLVDHNGAPVALGLARWMNQVAVEHGAYSGYITLDEYASASAPSSLWEQAAGIEFYERDPVNHPWGYGWGTLLRPVHLEAIGGIARLQSVIAVNAQELTKVPGGTVTQNQDGSVWLQLSPDIRDTTWQAIANLRGVLLPALAKGRRTLEEYYNPRPEEGRYACPFRL